MSAGLVMPPGTYTCPACGREWHGKSADQWYCHGDAPGELTNKRHAPVAVVRVCEDQEAVP